MANIDRVNGPIDIASLERTPIWEYPKIGPWFEIMTLVDADLRSGRRLETGRRSESIIYIYSFIPMSGCVGMGPSALLFPVACGGVKTILLLL